MSIESSVKGHGCPLCGHPQLRCVAHQCRENLGLLGQRYDYFRCLRCQVISQVPPPSFELLERYYSLIDERARSFRASSAGEAFLAKVRRHQQKKKSSLREQMRWLSSAGEETYPYWHLLKPGRLVDLGAGAGGFCLEAQARGWEVQGVEQSESSVRVAHELGAEVVRADLHSTEARKLIQESDNVVLNHVFEHIQNPEVFLPRLQSDMRPGTRLILLVPNPNSLWRYFFGRLWYGWDPPVHTHHYSAKALCKILENQGFKVIEIRSIRRNDSLTAAMSHVGIRVGRLRYILRLLMIPLMPFVAWIGFGPELLCVAEVPLEHARGGS